MPALKKAAWSALVALVLLTGCAPRSGPLLDPALTDAPQYGKFIWHDLITDDVNAARRFYGPLMGWTFEETQRPGGGPYTLIISAAGQYVGGMVELADPGDGRDYSRWLGYYAVPGVDEAVQATVEAGGEVLVGARDLASVARVAAIRDPEGAVVGLVTSKAGYPADRPVIGAGEIAWNELLAGDPAKLGGFYAALASGSVEETSRGDEPYYLLQEAGRDRAGIMLRPDPQLDPLWLTYFATADAASSADRAAALGGTVVVPADAEIRDGSIALVEDPTGAVFGLQRQTRGAK